MSRESRVLEQLLWRDDLDAARMTVVPVEGLVAIHIPKVGGRQVNHDGQRHRAHQQEARGQPNALTHSHEERGSTRDS